MSLMKTLAKVAIGVAVAKGASAMMKNRAGTMGAGAGLGGLLGGLSGGQAQGGAGLQDMLGGLMGIGVASAVFALVLVCTFEFARVFRVYDYRAFFKALI